MKKNIVLIPTERKYNNFVDVLKLFSEKQNNYVKIVNSILNLDLETFDDVFNMIEKSDEDPKLLMKVVEYAFYIRPLKRELLVKLYCKLAEKHGCTIFDVTTELKKVLISKGLLKDDYCDMDNYSLDELINFSQLGSIERIIMKDDIDAFVKLSSNPDFNPNQYESYYGVTKVFKFVGEKGNSMFDEKVTLTQMMALFGAIKCFKYAMMEGSYDFEYVEKYAIAGGNLEIIHLLENKNASFDFCFEVAIKYHRNNVADWLLNNYKCEIVSKYTCDVFYNETARMFIELNGINVPPHNKEMKMYSAVCKNDIAALRYLVEELHEDPTEGALMHCIGYDELEVPRYLVEKCHVDPIQKNEEDERTSLHSAMSSRLYIVTRYLIEMCGADPKLPDKWGMLPIHYAAKNLVPECIEYFVKECGVDVNARNEGNYTPLHFSFKHGDEAALMLAKLGADVNAIGEDGTTPFHMAVKYDRVKSVRYFVENCNADFKLKDKNGDNAIALSKQDDEGFSPESCYEYFNKELGLNNDENGNPVPDEISFFDGVVKGDMKKIKFIVEKLHIDLKTENKFGLTAFSLAAYNNNLDIMKYLVNECGFDPKYKSRSGKTALHFACLNGSLEAIDYLINTWKLDINEKDYSGVSCIYFCSTSQPVSFIEKLINEYGAILEKEGNSCPLFAKGRFDDTEGIMYFVDKHGIYIDIKNTNGATVTMCMATNGNVKSISQIIEKCHPDLTLKDNNGDNILVYAISSLNLDMVKYMVEKCNVDINSVNNDGENALHIATDENDVDIITYLVKNCKIPIDIKDKKGNTALLHAIINNNFETVRCLVEELGADINIANNKGISPLSYVKSNGCLFFEYYLCRTANLPMERKMTLFDFLDEKEESRFEYLINEAGESVYQYDSKGAMPIHIAALNSYIDTVELLIEEYDVPPDILDKNGMPPILYAIKGNSVKVFDLIYENYCRCLNCPTGGKEMKHFAAEYGSLNILKKLVDEEYIYSETPDDRGRTPLFYAIENGRKEIVEFLVKKVDISTIKPDKDGITLKDLCPNKEIEDLLVPPPKLTIQEIKEAIGIM